jgi:predicted dehydrogenase
VALAAAKTGCNLFIEKPLSHDLTDVDELQQFVTDKQLVGLVGYQLRFHPALLRTRQLLQERAFGNVLAVYATVGEYMPGWHPYEDYRSLYAARSDLGGGVVLSQIHELDYLYWLFGMPRRVFALGGHQSRLEIDVEDTASILMEGEFEGARIPIHLHQDLVQRPPSRTLTVIGDTGKAIVDFATPNLKVYAEDGSMKEDLSFPGFQRNQLFLDEMKHFLNCLAGQEQPRVSISEGKQSLRIALAAKESIQTGRVIELT